MKLGYMRVSTISQDLALQQRALVEAGCERIFTEQASGGRWDRPELQKMLEQLRPGDEVVVWKLDRLTRSLRDLLTIMERLRSVGASFRSLTEAIETSSAAGRMLMQMLGSYAEFDRAVMLERTRAGLQEARMQGRVGGRPRVLTPAQRQSIVDDVKSGRRTAAAAARLFGVSPSTVSRLLMSVMHSDSKG